LENLDLALLQTPPEYSDTLFAQIANDIRAKGFSIQPNALPLDLAESLHAHVMQMPEYQFDDAGIGRLQQLQQNSFVRRDAIAWINGDSSAGRDWLAWSARLQQYLNRHLFMGLFSFESHFAHYPPGSFYKKHLDAFKGQANRVLSVVVYLNPDWGMDDGGELVIYTDENVTDGIKVIPSFATIAVFLSEDHLHEVLPTQRNRYSIAGWYRVNSSNANRVDPPK
jgi:SM-20-related protein